MGVNFGMAYSGSSIGLLDRIGYSLFFKIYDSDKTEASSFYYVSSPDSENPVKTEIESYIFPGYYDEYKCYSIRDLSPCDLLSPLTVEFIREDITKDYQFSMLSYIKRVMGLSDSNESNVQLKATVTALYDYAVKADAFFNYTENSGE